MSLRMLNPNLNTTSDVDNQLRFFFKKFTIFLNYFKKEYQLEPIDNIINEIHFIVKKFLKSDFINQPTTKLLNNELFRTNGFSRDNFLENLLSKRNKTISPSIQLLEKLKNTSSLRDSLILESMAIPDSNFAFQKKDKGKKKLKECLENIKNKK